MKQQIAQHTYNDVPRRASLPPQHRGTSPAHYTRPPKTSRNAGVYEPHAQTSTRNSYTPPSTQQWFDEEDDDEPEYQSRRPRSAVVYQQPYTYVEPVTRARDDLPQQRRRSGLHPLVYVGLSMLIAVAFATAFIYIPSAWQRHVDDSTYGYPRTFQTDANVGHGGVSHFIVLNLHGTVEVVEIPPDPAKSTPHLYIIVRFANTGADLVPATVMFTDLNGDGKPDMLVTVSNGANPTMYVLYNDGTTFKPHL